VSTVPIHFMAMYLRVIYHPDFLYHATVGTEDEERVDRERSLIPRQEGELRLLAEDAAKEMDGSNFVVTMLFASLVLSVVVKYGELALDAPFNVGELSGPATLGIVIPTMLNIAKWTTKSYYTTSNFPKIF
jgi:hypothetical protein